MNMFYIPTVLLFYMRFLQQWIIDMSFFPGIKWVIHSVALLHRTYRYNIKYKTIKNQGYSQ